MDQQTNVRTAHALSFFVDKGWSKEQAAGIVGNLIQESSLNSDARNRGDGRDGTDSIGIGQWNQDRAKALHVFAAKAGSDWNDFATQLAFVDHELRGSEGAAGRRLAAATTVEDATAAVIGFERPAGWSAENPKGGHGWENRLNNARAAVGLEPVAMRPTPHDSLASPGAAPTDNSWDP